MLSASAHIKGKCSLSLDLKPALDEGKLLGGDKELPLCEVEVELKSGTDADALAYARVLARKFALRPEAKSKYLRALELAAIK